MARLGINSLHEYHYSTVIIMKVWTLFALYALSLLRPAFPAFVDDEKTLRTAVLTGYEYKIRPEEKVECNVRFSLLSINSLDVPGQSMSVAGWFTVRWNDTRLTWTAASNGHIDQLYDTELILWRPELIVDNSISNVGVIEDDKLLIRATDAGEMTWEPPGIFETHCEVDVTYYPFDVQICEIEVTSWSYTVEEVDLVARDLDVDLHAFQENGEWEILTTWSERRLLEDAGEYHSQVDFIIKLRRRPAYYVMTILIPAIVTSVLGLLVFMVPIDSGEKVGYTLTILLTYVVMLTLVAGYMPPTSKTTSILSIYLTIILFAGVLSTIITVIVLYFHHHTDARPVPPSLHSFFLKYIVPLTRWKRDEEGKEDDEEGEPQLSKVFVSTSNRVTPVGPAFDNETKKSPPKSDSKNGGDGEEEVVLSWQDMSLILDGLFFRVMGIGTVFLTVVVVIALLVGGYSSGQS